MPLRPCLDCGQLSDRGRCRTCRQVREAARKPSARQRGYDAAHDRRRAELLPLAYGTACPRCGEPMLPGQDLDLGHTVARSVDPTSRGDRMEHSRCNRSAGAR